jgi:hypothetical protein
MSIFRPYSSGVFSSRRIARHVDENIAFRVLAAGHRPDHRTICRFREQHLGAFEGLFVQVVQIARDAGLVKMGVLAIDDSKIHASTSKRKAISYERMKQEENRLRKASVGRPAVLGQGSCLSRGRSQSRTPVEYTSHLQPSSSREI